MLTDKAIHGYTEEDFWHKVRNNGFEFGLDGANGEPDRRHLENNPKVRKEYHDIIGHTSKRKLRADSAKHITISTLRLRSTPQPRRGPTPTKERISPSAGLPRRKAAAHMG